VCFFLSSRYTQETAFRCEVDSVQVRGGSDCVFGSACLLGVHTIAVARTLALYGKAGCLVLLV
jgi:hypothetical protein